MEGKRQEIIARMKLNQEIYGMEDDPDLYGEQEDKKETMEEKRKKIIARIERGGDDDEQPSFEDLYGEPEQLEIDKIRIKISDSKGNPLSLVEFNKTNTVGELKRKIEELMGIGKGTFRLGPRCISGRPDSYLLNDINWDGDKNVYVIPLAKVGTSKGGGKRRKTKSKRSRRKSRRSKRRSKKSRRYKRL